VKHLPKHLRPRWRYLAVEIESWPDANLDEGQLQRQLWYSAQNLLGDTGSADLDLTVIRFTHDEGVGEAIVRTRRETVERARGVIAATETVEAEAVGLRVAGVSGTIRACEEKYMGRRPEATGQRYVAFDGEQRTASARHGRLDVETGSGHVGATTLDI